jgi:NADPH-dependent ferric siderophore reductase
MNALHPAPSTQRPPPRLRQLQILHVDSPTPRLRRITLGGPELEGFHSAAPDDHVKLFFPTQDGSPQPKRDYTPRRHDPARGELVIEFVLHATGPASDWASRAEPGQWLGVGGPRGSRPTPDGYDAYLLAGDETALPSIGRRLEELPPGQPVQVLIEVADAREERYLPTAASASITWLHRNGRPAGDPTLLLTALQTCALPKGRLHAWLAAEIEVARTLRHHLIDQAGLTRDDIRAAGYWRLGIPDSHAKLED